MEELKKLIFWLAGITSIVGGGCFVMVHLRVISDVAGTFLFLGTMLIFSMGYGARTLDDAEGWPHEPTDEEIDNRVAISRRGEGVVK